MTSRDLLPGLALCLAGACRSVPVPDTSPAALHALFEEVFESRLERSPELRLRIGEPGDDGEWDDRSEAAADEDLRVARAFHARLLLFDPARLDAADRVSWKVLRHELEARIEGHRWRHHDYPVNQMHGIHAEVPAFLIAVHQVHGVADAENYVRRLRGIGPLFDQVIEGLHVRAELGVLSPRFVFPKVLEDCRNVVSGAPFEPEAADGPLLADFRGKVDALEGVPDEERARLLADARAALLEAVGPAYARLVAALEALESGAKDQDGCWKLPDGAAYYAWRLREITTTTLSPQEIHDLGLREVARIHGEMRAVQARVGFEGSLQDFFARVRAEPRFTLPETDEGRATYLAEVGRLLDEMSARLPELFGRLPRAELVVKAVEPYRERSAGKAFYGAGAADGSRPGTYYANLYRMVDMPTYQMEALAYHEGIPGHHMQVSIAQELQDVPRFRRFGRWVAYSEGWGLYSELLPKEIGCYADPYSDFGRLAMELWRACRLVVDTGIHHLRWTREEAIDYLRETTPNPEGDCVKAVERYIVMPGQATAYKIGMNEILRLREAARRSLGERFDLRAFHDTVLNSGPLPLAVLEEVVGEWVERVRADEP